METYDIVLFLHIFTLLAAIALSGILHHAEWQQRTATTIQELRLITRPFKLGQLFPVIIILLLAEGMFLIHLSDEAYGFDDAWVWTAIIALVILMVSGGAILGRHDAAYGELLAEAPDGPLTDEVRQAATNPTAWTVSHMNTGLALAVVFTMVTKPGTAGSIAVLVMGMAAGSVVGRLGAKPS